MSPTNSYRPRTTTPLSNFTAPEVTVKRYWLGEAQNLPRPELVERATRSIPEWIQNASHLAHEQAAILLIHQGKDGLYCVFGLWVEGNVMHLQSFRYQPETDAFASFAGAGGAVCVWEFPVLEWESALFRRTCVENDPKQGLTEYLGSTRAFTV